MEPWPWRAGPGCRSGTAAAACAAVSDHVDSDAAEGRGAEGGSSGLGDWCRAERAQLRTRERAFRERATAAWRAVEARAAGPATRSGAAGPGCRSGTAAAACAAVSDHVDSDAAEGRGAEGGSSGLGDWCRAERAQLRTRERAFRERATAAWRAVEARAAGPATQRGTTCHGGHGRRGAGPLPVTAGAGSRPLGTVVTATDTATPATITAPVTAITVTGSGQQARFPRGVGRRGSGFHQGGRAGQNRID
jgi:hypothetical protein